MFRIEQTFLFENANVIPLVPLERVDTLTPQRLQRTAILPLCTRAPNLVSISQETLVTHATGNLQPIAASPTPFPICIIVMQAGDPQNRRLAPRFAPHLARVLSLLPPPIRRNSPRLGPMVQLFI